LIFPQKDKRRREEGTYFSEYSQKAHTTEKASGGERESLDLQYSSGEKSSRGKKKSD